MIGGKSVNPRHQTVKMMMIGTNRGDDLGDPGRGHSVGPTTTEPL